MKVLGESEQKLKSPVNNLYQDCQCFVKHNGKNNVFKEVEQQLVTGQHFEYQIIFKSVNDKKLAFNWLLMDTW